MGINHEGGNEVAVRSSEKAETFGLSETSVSQGSFAAHLTRSLPTLWFKRKVGDVRSLLDAASEHTHPWHARQGLGGGLVTRLMLG